MKEKRKNISTGINRSENIVRIINKAEIIVK